jgi:hypothetical protein
MSFTHNSTGAPNFLGAGWRVLGWRVLGLVPLATVPWPPHRFT